MGSGEPPSPDDGDGSTGPERGDGPDRIDPGPNAGTDSPPDRDPTDEGGGAVGGPDRRDATDRPAPEPGTDAGTGRGDDDGLVRTFRTARTGPLMWVREVATSALIVLAIGLVLFAISGVWPPMVAVSSGSMDPNMEEGDLVFVTEPGRFAPDAAENGLGVVTAERGAETGYRSFGGYGSVIVFREPGSGGLPVIHRAAFHVEEGENWYDRADPSVVRAEECGATPREALPNCPAPHDGFITKGDDNPTYDQELGIAPPVRAGWITGVARLRVPYLGWVRLAFSGASGRLPPATVTLVAAGAAGVAARPRRAG